MLVHLQAACEAVAQPASITKVEEVMDAAEAVYAPLPISSEGPSSTVPPPAPSKSTSNAMSQLFGCNAIGIIVAAVLVLAI
jgi:hypothetical protein